MVRLNAATYSGMMVWSVGPDILKRTIVSMELSLYFIQHCQISVIFQRASRLLIKITSWLLHIIWVTPAVCTLPPALPPPAWWERDNTVSLTLTFSPSPLRDAGPGWEGGVVRRSGRDRVESLLKDHMGWLRNPITCWLSIDPEPSKY